MASDPAAISRPWSAAGRPTASSNAGPEDARADGSAGELADGSRDRALARSERLAPPTGKTPVPASSDGNEIGEPPAARPAPARRRPAATRDVLRGLAEEHAPRNNDQRTTLAVAALERVGGIVDAVGIAAAYDAVAWRTPVNLGTSLRATVRAGLIEDVGGGRFALTDAGRAYAGA